MDQKEDPPLFSTPTASEGSSRSPENLNPLIFSLFEVCEEVKKDHEEILEIDPWLVMGYLESLSFFKPHTSKEFLTIVSNMRSDLYEIADCYEKADNPVTHHPDREIVSSFVSGIYDLQKQKTHMDEKSFKKSLFSLLTSIADELDRFKLSQSKCLCFVGMIRAFSSMNYCQKNLFFQELEKAFTVIAFDWQHPIHQHLFNDCQKALSRSLEALSYDL